MTALTSGRRLCVDLQPAYNPTTVMSTGVRYRQKRHPLQQRVSIHHLAHTRIGNEVEQLDMDSCKPIYISKRNNSLTEP